MSGSDDNTLRVWNATTGKVQCTCRSTCIYMYVDVYVYNVYTQVPCYVILIIMLIGVLGLLIYMHVLYTCIDICTCMYMTYETMLMLSSFFDYTLYIYM